MFKKLTEQEIEQSLGGTTRQYLVGHLQLPQALNHIDDTNIEIGITDYKEFTIEQPHWHKVAYEYQYVISGKTKYIDIENGEEMSYTQGDFYRIEPTTAYAQKSIAGTKILFIKTPPGNDKVSEEASIEIKKWFDNWD